METIRLTRMLKVCSPRRHNMGNDTATPAASTSSCFVSHDFHAFHVTTTHQQVTRHENSRAAPGLALTWPRCVKSLDADEASGWRPARVAGDINRRGRSEGAWSAKKAAASRATAESEIFSSRNAKVEGGEVCLPLSGEIGKDVERRFQSR